MRQESSAPEPSVAYAIAVLIAASLLAIAVTGPRWYLLRVQYFPDMLSYSEAANAVRHWRLDGIPARQFWGYAYAGALASWLEPGVPMLIVLLTVSAAAGCVAVALAHRLWGGWTAVYLTAVGWPFIQRVAFGGSEPLSLALLFATFLAARNDQWRRAALYAALATIVRPIGIFALGAVLVMAVVRRRPVDAVIGFALAATVTGLYLVPLAKTGDALGNIHFYSPQMPGGTPIGVPFFSLWQWARNAQVSLLRQILLAGAVVVVLLAPFAAFRREKIEQAENLFAIASSCFLITFNCPGCAWGFPRYAIVSLPLALVAVRRRLPRDDRVVAVLSVCASLIAAGMQVDDPAPGTLLLHLFSAQ